MNGKKSASAEQAFKIKLTFPAWSLNSLPNPSAVCTCFPVKHSEQVSVMEIAFACAC